MILQTSDFQLLKGVKMEQNKALRLLGLATRAGKIAFGTESVIDTINKKKAKLVIVAEDAADRTKKNIQKYK